MFIFFSFDLKIIFIVEKKFIYNKKYILKYFFLRLTYYNLNAIYCILPNNIILLLNKSCLEKYVIFNQF